MHRIENVCSNKLKWEAIVHGFPFSYILYGNLSGRRSFTNSQYNFRTKLTVFRLYCVRVWTTQTRNSRRTINGNFIVRYFSTQSTQYIYFMQMSCAMQPYGIHHIPPVHDTLIPTCILSSELLLVWVYSKHTRPNMCSIIEWVHTKTLKIYMDRNIDEAVTMSIAWILSCWCVHSSANTLSSTPMRSFRFNFLNKFRRTAHIYSDQHSIFNNPDCLCAFYGVDRFDACKAHTFES